MALSAHGPGERWLASHPGSGVANNLQIPPARADRLPKRHTDIAP